MTRPLSRLRPSSDDDPTGVQRILATLPDPGPMPPQLVERISASLAAERELRGKAPAAVTALPADRGERRGGSKALLLGLSGAAAAAAIGGVVMINFIGPAVDPAPNTQAQFHLGAPVSSPPAGSVADSEAGADSMTGATGATGALAGPRSTSGGDVQVQVSSTHYTSAALAAQADRLWASPGEPVRALGAEAPAIGPIGTELGATQCLAAIGAADASRALVDLAFYDGSPAAVVVTEGNGHRSVRVVSRHCGPQSDAMLAGPITLR